MSRPVAVLRPEPGNAQTAARISERGLTPLCLPLFGIAPLAWTCPDTAGLDALIITSANTVRHAGPSLTTLRALPVFAVGAATAAAARMAGLDVRATGDSDAAALIDLAAAQGIRNALHLGGREAAVGTGGIIRQTIAVYGSDPIEIDVDRLRQLAGTVALLHSARAAVRLGGAVAQAGLDRRALRVAAISPAVADAAGIGWDRLETAQTPSDAALIDAAARLAD